MKKQQLLTIILFFSISIALFPQTSKTKNISGSSGKTLKVKIQKEDIFSGFVKDRDGKPIEGVEIEFENTETKEIEKRNTTNALGNYIVKLILNKNYIVTLFKKGFASKTIELSFEDVKDEKLFDIILDKEYSNPPEVYINPTKDTIYQRPFISIAFQIVVKEKNFKEAIVFHNDKEVKIITKENIAGLIRDGIEVDLAKRENEIRVVAYGLKEPEFTEKTINVYYKPTDSKYYALLIAVEEYQNTELVKLDFPISDAEKLQRILTNKYTFEKENLYLLKNPTKAELEDKLDELKSIITDKDNLLIFYAGHGGYNKDKKVGYWLLADASRKYKHYLNGTLRDNIALIPSRHTLLISDACFSGAIFKTRSLPDLEEDSVEDFSRKMKNPSKKAMTSGNLEEVPDKSELIEAIHYYLNYNMMQYTTSLKLFSSISDDVKNNDFQYGTINNVGDKGGDFIFIKRRIE